MNHHQERLRGLLLEVGSDIIHRVKDPAVFPPDKEGTEILTVTDVSVSPDGSLAKFYISLYGAGDERKKAVADGLNKAKGFLHRELAKELHLRTIPSVVFYIDETQDHADRLMKILDGLSEQKNADENL